VNDGYNEVFGKQYFALNKDSQGVFVQKSGYTDHALKWNVDVDRNWILANGSNSVAVVQIEGGVITNRADIGFCVGADSRTYFTMEAGECITLRPANSNRGKNGGSLTVLNLNGGVFGAWNIARALPLEDYPTGACVQAFCNFNGGTFKTLNENYHLFGAPGAGNWREPIDRVTVYERGAAISVPASQTASVDVPLSAPTGKGVSSVAWSDTGVKYVGSPIVEIIGDGTGASAFAQFDSVKGEVTGVKVTSPGCDYTWAKAIIRYGNEAPVTNAAVTLAEFKSGSFTKKGAGTLAFNAANSYGGDTVIEEGTLSVNVAGAIPDGSAIVLKGGSLVAGNGVELPAATFRFDLLNPVNYPGAFEFPSGSVIEIANLDKADTAVGSHIIATFTAGLSGVLPEIANQDEVPPRWNLIKSGKSLKLRYSRGTVLSIR
jgi:autotransporter-associated beta strand protein